MHNLEKLDQSGQRFLLLWKLFLKFQRKRVYIFGIIDGKPHEAADLIHLDVTDSWTAEEFLRDLVVEAFPLNEYSDPSVFCCLIFDLRVFHGDKVQVILAVFLFHYLKAFLPFEKQYTFLWFYILIVADTFLHTNA